MTNDDAFKAKEAQDILENILWGFCGGYWNNKEKMQRMRKDIEKSVKILDGLTKKYIEEYDAKKHVEDPIYLNEKQAATRYGYSRAWFQRNRWLGTGPKFIKVNDNGRVLYPIKETDEWFANFGYEKDEKDN